MKIISDVQITVVVNATEKANQLLLDDTFFQKIAAHERFDMANVKPAIIAGLLRTSALEFHVTTFTPKWYEYFKYRKTDAYTDGHYPNTLFLNSNKLDYSVAYQAATIIHESIHALDASSDYEFGHGDNERKGKENTAPYWIGSLAFEILTGQKPAENELQFQKIASK